MAKATVYGRPTYPTPALPANALSERLRRVGARVASAEDVSAIKHAIESGQFEMSILIEVELRRLHHDEFVDRIKRRELNYAQDENPV